MPTIEQTIVAGIETGNSLALESWSPQDNELLLLFIAQRNEEIAPSVSGNSLTWVEVMNRDNVQGQCGISIWRAMGSPSSGQITITVTGNTTPVLAIACRVSGVDTSGENGAGAVEATAYNDGPAVDNNDMKESITTLTDGATVLAFGTHRTVTFTTPAGQDTVLINQLAGSGGNATRGSLVKKEVASAGAVEMGGDDCLSNVSDWVIGLLSIKPASAGGYEEDLSFTATAATSITDLQGYREALAVTAQHAGSLADVQHYREALTIAQTATVLAQEVQKYIEQLNVVLAQQATLVDLQGYRESLLLSAEAQLAIGDLQHYRDALALAAQVVATVLDELGSTMAELLSVTGLATVSIREEQHYREALAATALAQISGADVQAYRESLSIIITQLATLRDVLHGLITGIRYRFTHSVQTEFQHERHTAFQKEGPVTQFSHSRKTDFIHRGSYEFKN